MDKIRLICIVFITCIICSGCTIESNIKVMSDGSVIEKINVVGNHDISDINDETIKKKINNNYNYLISSYDYDYKFDDKINLFLEKKYNSLSNYLKNENISLLFEDYELFEYQGIVSFKNTGNTLYNKLFYYEDIPVDNYYTELVDKIIIKIQFENVVVDNNADSYDEKTNTYTWVIDKENQKKDIEFSFDSTKKVNLAENNDKRIFIIIGFGLLILIVLIFKKMFSKVNKL